MTELLVVSDGWDPTAQLLGDAGRRLGGAVTELDLRLDRLTVEVGPEGADVRHRGRRLRPDVVVNRSGITGLGLADGALLERQRPHGWFERHVAARQEQGLLLAATDAWARSGATVLNPPTSEDLSLLTNAVVERLARRGVRTRRAGTSDEIEIVVASGRGVTYRADGEAPDRSMVEVATIVAAAAGFDVGSVRLVSDDRGVVVTGWDHRPELSTWPDADRIALGILLTVPGLDGRELGTTPPRFFAEDLDRR
ncbi:MAG: hypothetical protein AAGA99_11515 [Actinomycetota bacterium]